MLNRSNDAIRRSIDTASCGQYMSHITTYSQVQMDRVIESESGANQ